MTYLLFEQLSHFQQLKTLKLLFNTIAMKVRQMASRARLKICKKKNEFLSQAYMEAYSIQASRVSVFCVGSSALQDRK